MDNHKFCIIMCTNNRKYEQEAQYYIKQLIIPSGYTLETHSIYGAKSMTEGYQEGMLSCDAKYKIYIHQDVFIVNRNILSDVLRIFSNSKIGLIGMVGNKELPVTCIPWNGPRIGKLYSSNIHASGESIIGEIEQDYEQVEGVDGLCIMTQYDIPWRTDLFTGWDFYDLSQCQEFIRKGYQIVVPHMETAWCLHDDGIMNLSNYHKYREIFIKEYKGETENSAY